MGSNNLQGRGSGQVVDLQPFGKKGAGQCGGSAHDLRRLRLDTFDNMASMLAHELAQPLATSANYLHACAAQVRERIEGLEDILATIASACAQNARAMAILRTMRSFALSGQVAAQSIELRRVVDDALGAVPGIGDVEVSVSYHSAGVYVIADRIQLGQVLVNLFANAVDAMRGSRIKLLRIVTSAEGDETRIRIEDHGPGLSPEIFDRLFEPFVTSKAHGTGLGLPICDTIIEAHGGRLWAEPPVPGRGAAFNILLPAKIKGEPL